MDFEDVDVNDIWESIEDNKREEAITIKLQWRRGQPMQMVVLQWRLES